MRTRRLLRLLPPLLGLAALGLGLLAADPGSRTGYVARAAVYQAEMLLWRVPLEDALAGAALTDDEREALRLVPRIKRFGEEHVGLARHGSYDTVNPTWRHVIFNVSAAEPLSFTPRRWWFPVVGEVPYLGFFDEAQATARADVLRDEGLDVHVRTAGAYSTLGWFADPVLPGMLRWSEDRLAQTLLHELAHGTLWVPGSVAFNESFASFVGEQAADRYLVHVYGEESEVVREARQRDADEARYVALLQGLYHELDAIYRHPALTDDEKLRRKQALLDTLPQRAAGAGFHDVDRWTAALEPSRWNNARLVQFRTYNRSQDWFAALLDQVDGDLPRFLARVRDVAGDAPDPYAALAGAVGAQVPGDPSS